MPISEIPKNWELYGVFLGSLEKMHRILPPTAENITILQNILNCSGLVSFPTETVYGLAGNALDDAAVSKIFLFKSRPEFNPLPVCYPSLDMAATDVFVCDRAMSLAEKFLPGPITLLLRRRADSRISWLCSAGLDTICVRIPSHPIAKELLSGLPFPLAVTSANKSMQMSSTTAQAVSESLENNDNLVILDGGHCPIGIESTIVDLTEKNPRILRYGAISEEEISRKCGLIFEKVSETTGKMPSTSLPHYVPRKKMALNAVTSGPEDAILAFGEPFSNACKHVLNLSLNGDLTEAASNLFFMLRELDKTDASGICVMPIPNEGIGVAINDRLKKAAASFNK